MFNQYPYLNIQDLNLDYIMKAIKEMRYDVTNFVSINAIKYADPIQWDITSQYEKNTIVIDPVTGTAYISVAPVPAGVALTRPEYWTVVFDLGSFVTRAAQNFTSRWESDTTTTATFPTNAGEWLVWGDVLYKALVNITAGDSYVIGGNIERFSMEDIIGHLNDLNTTDKTNLVAAINEVLQTIANISGNLDDLDTNDKTNLVAAINEVLQTIANISGNLDDLDTNDKTNLVAAINEVFNSTPGAVTVFMPCSKTVPAGTYASGCCTVTITKSGKTIMIDSGAVPSWPDIESELDKLGITFLNYFILSHYHSDHYGNIQSLITKGLITADTKTYIPRYAGIVVPGIDDEALVRSLLAFTNPIEPNSSTVITLDDVKVSFFNCDKADYDYYNGIGSAYNNYSMCNYITYKNTKILMTADLMSDGIDHVVSEGMITPCDIMQVPHHGRPNAPNSIFLAAAPSYSVVSIMYNDIDSDLNDYNQIKINNTLNSKTYACGNGAVYVGMGDSLYSVLSEGTPLQSNYTYTFTVYVGNNTRRGDGTAVNPFNNINDALAFVSSLGVSNLFRIELLSGWSCDDNITIKDVRGRILIINPNGLTDFSGKITINNSNVQLYNIHHTWNGEGIGIECNQSIVALQNCTIDGTQKTGSLGNQRGVAAENSRLIMSNCTISNKGVAIASMPNSSVVVNGCTGSDNTYLCGGAINIMCEFYNCTIAYSSLVGYAANSFKCNYNNVYCFDNTAPYYTLYRDVTGPSPTKTITLDLTDSIYSGGQIEVSNTNGDIYIIDIWTSSLSTPQQTVVGSLEASQVTNITRSGRILTVEYNFAIRITMKR